MTSIRDEARTEAEIQFPARDPREGETTYPWSSIAVFKRRAFALGYIAGANREPSDAYVATLTREFRRVWDERVEMFDPEEHDETPFIEGIMRAALLAAQEGA